MIRIVLICLFLFGAVLNTYAQHRIIEGVVKDSESLEPLPFAHVFLKNKALGTMTNRLGQFRLIVPQESDQDSLVVSFIGFKQQYVSLQEVKKPLVLVLEENTTSLQEVVVKGFTAETIVKKAIEKIPQNYRRAPYLSSGFYRVTSEKDNQYIHLSEAVFDMYQSNQDQLDQRFSLTKMRAIKDEKASRGIDLGLKPAGVFQFDLVNHIDDFGLLNDKGLGRHIFKMEGIESVNGKDAYKISFDQREVKKSGYKGYMLIDKESEAFVYFDFGLSDKGLKYFKYGDGALRAMMRIMGIQITMSRNNYQIRYKKLGDRYVLNNVGNDATLTFKSDREHYNFTVDTRVDYLVSDIRTDDVKPFPKEEVLRQSKMIEEQHSSYDPDFWKDYNIVLPTSDFNEIANKLEANNKANDLKLSLESRLSKMPKNAALRIDSIVSFYNDKDLFNGNILISHEGRVVLQKSYNNSFTKNQKDSQFRIGSVSKTFTAMLIARLESQGMLKYTDSIKTFLPNYAHPNITISQLLSHQSGIPNYLTKQDYLTQILSNTYSTGELVELFCSDALDFEPGFTFEYSNSNFVILALIIEKIMAKDFSSVMQSEIFVPLQMDQSFSGMSSKDTNLVTGYLYGKPEPAYAIQNVVGAGGISSTAQDLLKWSEALDTERLLSHKEFDTMIERHVAYTDYDAFYGYGWLIDGYKFSASKKHQVIYHPGTDFGFYAMFVKQPETKTTVILLNNTGDFPRFEMTELILNELN